MAERAIASGMTIARILVVEDDPTVAEVVTGLLESLGHRTAHAAHGIDQKADRQHMNLVRQDVILEVAGEVHLGDDADLEVGLLAHRVGDAFGDGIGALVVIRRRLRDLRDHAFPFLQQAVLDVLAELGLTGESHRGDLRPHAADEVEPVADQDHVRLQLLATDHRQPELVHHEQLLRQAVGQRLPLVVQARPVGDAVDVVAPAGAREALELLPGPGGAALILLERISCAAMATVSFMRTVATRAVFLRRISPTCMATSLG